MRLRSQIAGTGKSSANTRKRRGEPELLHFKSQNT
jgi:hypothetical protein